MEERFECVDFGVKGWTIAISALVLGLTMSVGSEVVCILAALGIL